MQNRPSLRLSNLTVRKENLPLVSDVSLEFQTGQVAVILGATGSGKSTLVRAIAGLERPTSGRISLDPTDLTNVAAYKRSGIATVLQRPGVFPRTTPRQNIEMVFKSNAKRSASVFNATDNILRLLDLTELADKKVDGFSGGELARVALARAIAVDSTFLIIDEALSAVDAPLRRRILKALTDDYMSQNKGLIFVTHDQLDAFMFADHLVLLDEGKVVADGQPMEVYRTPPNRCVGEFLGLATPLGGIVDKNNDLSGDVTAYLPELAISVNVRFPHSVTWSDNQPVTVIVRPEDIVVRPTGVGIAGHEIEAYVKRTIFSGSSSYLLLNVAHSGIDLISRDPSDYAASRFYSGERVTFMFKNRIAAVCN